MNEQNLNPEIQAEVNKIATSIHAKGWKLSRKITQKSLRELEELGLTDYISGRNRYQEIIHAVIAAATEAGGKKSIHSEWTRYGDAEVWEDTTKAHPLYLLLNPEPETDEPQSFTIIQVSDTDYAQVPTGIITDRSLADIIQQYDLEQDGNILRAEWGNGEGYDEYRVENV